MHQKKRKLHKLHSIPIGLCNKVNHNRLYLVSYSIPLSCMVVLLLGFSVMFNPGLFLVDKSSAVTIQDEWAVEKSGSASDSGDGVDSDVHEQSAEDSDTAMLLSESYTENNPPTNDATAGITFSIGGAAKDATIEATPGAVAYREHTVAVNLTNADEYAMFISGNGSNDIILDTNASAKLVSMASAVVGSDIPAGEWGYGWDYTGSKSKEEMTYQAVPSTQTEILTPKIDGATNTASFTGNLNFAGKFPEGAAIGNYVGGTATLALVVSPKGATGGALWKRADGSDSNYYSGIYTMQEIDTVTRDGGFCKNNPAIQTGWTIELQDNRGPNPVEKYKIVKLEDGNCWMQENLRLGGSSAMELTSDKTALDLDTTSWILPASSDSYWSNNNTLAQIRVGKSDMAVNSQYPGDGKGWQSSYGNYYSWCAATAGSCSSATTNGAVAGGSICPKNWHLPTGGGSGANGIGEFSVFNGLNPASIKADPYKFPAAGVIEGNNNGFVIPGTRGFYWSRTSAGNYYVHILDFYGSAVFPGESNYRYFGYSVRCVADY